MASSIIHLAIAKKVLENITVDNEKDYYLGSIAPDISKQIGHDKEEAHFQKNSKKEIPNLNLFIKRYPFFKYNSFDLGYFIHLYTDKLWHEEFLQKIRTKKAIQLLDGTTFEGTNEEIKNMIYSDYTNLNTKIIDEYNLDLSLFYEEYKIPKTNIKEIPIDKLDILINKMGILIENSKEEKTYLFNIELINDFIEETTKTILETLKEY